MRKIIMLILVGLMLIGLYTSIFAYNTSDTILENNRYNDPELQDFPLFNYNYNRLNRDLMVEPEEIPYFSQGGPNNELSSPVENGINGQQAIVDADEDVEIALIPDRGEPPNPLDLDVRLENAIADIMERMKEEILEEVMNEMENRSIEMMEEIKNDVIEEINQELELDMSRVEETLDNVDRQVSDTQRDMVEFMTQNVDNRLKVIISSSMNHLRNDIIQQVEPRLQNNNSRFRQQTPGNDASENNTPIRIQQNNEAAPEYETALNTRNLTNYDGDYEYFVNQIEEPNYEEPVRIGPQQSAVETGGWFPAIFIGDDSIINKTLDKNSIEDVTMVIRSYNARQGSLKVYARNTDTGEEYLIHQHNHFHMPHGYSQIQFQWSGSSVNNKPLPPGSYRLYSEVNLFSENNQYVGFMRRYWGRNNQDYWIKLEG